MAYGYKAKTNASQVNIRDWYSTSGTSKGRLAKDSVIEASTNTYKDSNGDLWRMVSYNYDKHGYMLGTYITNTDTTPNKYYMNACMEAFGDKIWVRGNSDLYNTGPIRNIQYAINAVNRSFYYEGQLNVDTDGVFGSNTEKSLRAFQKFAGCGVDGKAGPHTKARLYRVAYGQGGWPLAENAE